MIPRHGKANLPNKRPCISIGACTRVVKNGVAGDLTAATASNGSALSTKTTAIKRQNEPKARSCVSQEAEDEMCNLYNIKMHSAQLKKAVGSYIDLTNGASFDGKIYPDYPAPILRNNRD